MHTIRFELHYLQVEARGAQYHGQAFCRYAQGDTAHVPTMKEKETETGGKINAFFSETCRRILPLTQDTVDDRLGTTIVFGSLYFKTFSKGSSKRKIAKDARKVS